jgi:hypothetical protein
MFAAVLVPVAARRFVYPAARVGLTRNYENEIWFVHHAYGVLVGRFPLVGKSRRNAISRDARKFIVLVPRYVQSIGKECE